MLVVWSLLNQSGPDQGRGLASHGQDDQLRSVPDVRTFPLSELAHQSALVVSAHPDDEVIGAGAMLSRLETAGVITVTGGVPGNGRSVRVGLSSNWRYVRARRREAEAALSLLPRPLNPVTNLGLPDQRVVFHLSRLVRQMVRLFRVGSFSTIITHAYEGGDPDHDATALAVHGACQLLERQGVTAPSIVEMAGYHMSDGQMVYGEFMPHPDAGPVERFQLGPGEIVLKRAMLDCHQTQAAALAGFALTREAFRRAPSYNFLLPPSPHTLAYETYGWEINGQIWRRAAARAMHALDLLDDT
jgi:LmbE family N-acetylglucosaminyl deacetylase